MSNAIATLSVLIDANAQGFKEGIVPAKRDLADLKKIVKDTEPPIEVFARKTALLNKMLADGAVTPEQYSRALAVLQNRFDKASAAADNAAGAIGHANNAMDEPPQTGIEFATGRLTGNLPIVGELAQAGAAAGPMGVAIAALLAGVTAGAYAASTAISTIADSALTAIDRIDAIGDSAQALGMQASAFQRITIAATLADAPVESLANALGKMESLLGESSPEAVKKFEAIGLSAEKLRRLAPDEQFRRVASAIEALPDRPAQLSAITDIFGKSNRELVNLIDGMAEFEREANKFTLTESQFAAVGDADMAFKRLELTVEGIQNQLGAELSPAIADAVNAVTNLLQQDATQSALLTGMNALAATLQVAADGAQAVKDVDLPGIIGDIGDLVQSQGASGLLLREAWGIAMAPFSESAEAARRSRELDKQLQAMTGDATGAMLAELDATLAEKKRIEKESADLESERLQRETKYVDAIRKLAQQKREIENPESRFRREAIEAGAVTEARIQEYTQEAKALEELKKAKADMVDQERKRLAEEERIAASRKTLIESLRSPFEKARDEMQRAMGLGLDQSQLDAFSGRLVEGLLPKGNMGPVTGFQKGSREAVAFEQSAARADRQAKILEQIRDRLSAKLFEGAVSVEEVELP